MKSKLTVILIVVMILTLPASALGNAATPEALTATRVVRLDGIDRYETAISVANELAKQMGIDYSAGKKLQNVVLASGNDYADALAGVPLAGKLKAPILLVDNIPSNSALTLDYIKEHLSTSGTIYILGGVGVIPTSFNSALNGMGFSDIRRIGGADRNETSLLIAKQVDNPNHKVYLVSGTNFYDAETIAPWSIAEQAPIILVSELGLSIDQKEFCDQQTTVVARGELRSKLPAIYPRAIGVVDGDNRYARSAAFLELMVPMDKVFLANGEDYPDALTGAVLAGLTTGKGILLTRSEQLPSEIADGLDILAYVNKQTSRRYAPRWTTPIMYPTVYIFGGTGVVSDEVVGQVQDILNGPGSL